MDLKSLGQIVAKYGAPLLGTVVGGPAGAALGQIIASEFGGSLDDSDELIKKIEADPNAALKCFEIQSNNKVQLQELALQMAQAQMKREIDLQDIAAKDAADARENNVKSKSWMPEIISILVMLGFFGCMWLLVSYKQDSEDHEVLYSMFGSLTAAFGAVIQYWVGSSASSQMKDLYLSRKAK